LNKLESIKGTTYDISGSGIEKVEISLKVTKDANLWDGDARVNNYWDGREWRSKETWLPTIGTDEWVYNSSIIPYSTGNEYLISCRGVDQAGNLEVPTGGNLFMFDAIQPENLSIYINNGDEYASSNSVTLSVQAEDIGSGVSKLAFSTDNREWSEWIPFIGESNFTLPSNDGEKTVFFRVKDYAGNIAEPVQDIIYLDTTAPKDLSIRINGNDKYTNSKNVKFTLKGVDVGSGIEDAAYSYDGINWQSWEPYGTTRRFTILAGDGEIIIYFKLRDNAGNIAEPVFDTIILDTTPPQSLMVVINNGATETNSTLVTLNFNAIDDASRVAEMSLSDDGIIWGPWENYTFFKYYTLSPGEGTKTIYVKVKDTAGNEAEPTSASITIASPPQPKEESRDTSFTISSMEFWYLLLFLITIILLVTNMVLMLKRKRVPEHEIPSAALTIKPGQRFAAAEPSAQVPPAMKLDQLPGTVAVSASQQATVSTPTLAKSTQVAVAPSHGAVPDLPALPPARIEEEGPEASTSTAAGSIPEPAVAQSPSVQPTIASPTMPMPAADVQPQTAIPIQQPPQAIEYTTPDQPTQLSVGVVPTPTPQAAQSQPSIAEPDSENQKSKQETQNQN
jgi:hypothetical protein